MLYGEEMFPSNFLKNGWVRFGDAEDLNGNYVQTNSDAACRFSVNGALIASFEHGHISYDNYECLRDIIIEFISKEVQTKKLPHLSSISIIDWNEDCCIDQDDAIKIMQYAESQMCVRLSYAYTNS